MQGIQNVSVLFLSFYVTCILNGLVKGSMLTLVS